jgi:hypothetical protein
MWRGGRAVECSGLENRRTFAGLVGSNPTLSSGKAVATGVFQVEARRPGWEVYSPV